LAGTCVGYRHIDVRARVRADEISLRQYRIGALRTGTAAGGRLILLSDIWRFDLFLGLVIGLPSRDSLIDCVDQLYVLSMASAAALDTALDGELLMQVGERLAVWNGIVLRHTGYITTSGATNILDRSVLGTIRWVATLELLI